MTTGNENSPLTRNASGQENGTEIEARGLSSPVNGTQTENLTSRKSPAPEQASEATAARPSMEDSTAEGIFDARTAGGNETSSELSRADALTAIADDMRAEQAYLGSCRESCDNCGRSRWDRLQLGHKPVGMGRGISKNRIMSLYLTTPELAELIGCKPRSHARMKR
ncbi:hypothetical protein KDW63_12250 [Burkholderia cenocepacia]|uniref:hypothetical protein n=1 Tax=Burkholderia cenocepacia TaxID=95486 RepID=UPI001B9567A5|nr:hypothetical protein [Burkholderia cenocepacia]MBR8294955.1 hypothetical protein [Burkholderia cenocepacia]